jgi:hypothetical protein
MRVPIGSVEMIDRCPIAFLTMQLGGFDRQSGWGTICYDIRDTLFGSRDTARRRLSKLVVSIGHCREQQGE